MKHLTIRFFAACLLLIAGASTASAYDFEVDGIYYNLGEDSCATVTYGKSTSNTYKDTVNIPKVVVYNEKEYPVTAIGRQAFYNCSALTCVSLPESMRMIDSWAFGKCSALEIIEIPDSVKEIGDFAFESCTGLKRVSINTPMVSTWFAGLENLEKVVLGNDVIDMEDGAFSGCTALASVTINTPVLKKWFANLANLKELILGEKVIKVEKNAIPDSTAIYTLAGSKTLLALWAAGYEQTHEIGTGEQLPPTTLTFVSATQSTASFRVGNIYPDYVISYNGKPLRGSQVQMTNLRPDTEGEASVDVTLDDVVFQPTAVYKTLGINPYLKETAIGSTSFGVIGTYEEGDANVTAQRVEANDSIIEGSEVSVTGLDPLKTYKVKYVATVSYGEEEDSLEAEYADSLWITTGQLVLRTLAPKVVSKGEVIVAAESNIINDEESVGFEWRRTDAPSSVASKSGAAYLYEGTMEGLLHNLTSSNYWNYRPYYESKSGKRYYGEWGTVEADDDSYFEPTVHTYAKINVEGNEAEVNGYALRGTDEVEEQGFVYWEDDENGGNGETRFYNLTSHRAPAIPDGAKTATATGQVMNATLKGLNYNRTYHYVAYMKTAKGDTYYGEERSFKTAENTTGIETINRSESPVIDNTGIYDLNGHKLTKMQRGLNIIRMSNGTVRKVMVK